MIDAVHENQLFLCPQFALLPYAIPTVLTDGECLGAVLRLADSCLAHSPTSVKPMLRVLIVQMAPSPDLQSGFLYDNLFAFMNTDAM
jgi:hypothetical protein